MASSPTIQNESEAITDNEMNLASDTNSDIGDNTTHINIESSKSTTLRRRSVALSSGNDGKKKTVIFAEDFEPILSQEQALLCAQAGQTCSAIGRIAVPQTKKEPFLRGSLFQKIIFAGSLNNSASVKRRSSPGGFPKGRKPEPIKYPMWKSKSAHRAALAGDSKVRSCLQTYTLKAM